MEPFSGDPQGLSHMFNPTGSDAHQVTTHLESPDFPLPSYPLLLLYSACCFSRTCCCLEHWEISHFGGKKSRQNTLLLKYPLWTCPCAHCDTHGIVHSNTIHPPNLTASPNPSAIGVASVQGRGA
ncbi:unnamed protein product [Caretta caretta]